MKQEELIQIVIREAMEYMKEETKDFAPNERAETVALMICSIENLAGLGTYKTKETAYRCLAHGYAMLERLIKE